MIVTTLVALAAEPWGLAEAKDYLRIAGSGEDGLVGALISAARSRIEQLAGVVMISRTLRATLDAWPQGMMGRVRAALTSAALEMEGWRCVLLVQVFADAMRQKVGQWRTLLRIKAVVELA
jgi:uncharacterized phiE125 gp8 family phage protein